MVTIAASAISSATAIAVALIGVWASQRKQSSALTDCQERLAMLERWLEGEYRQ